MRLTLSKLDIKSDFIVYILFFYTQCGTAGSDEKQTRLNISYLIHSYLTMMYASSSSSLCHDWYTTALIELHRTSGIHSQSMPNKDGSLERVKMPASLKKVSDANTPNGTVDAYIHVCVCTSSSSYVVSVQELSCNAKYQLALFREMCGLLWLLHVRDNASHHLRQVFPSKPSDKVGIVGENTYILYMHVIHLMCPM